MTKKRKNLYLSNNLNVSGNINLANNLNVAGNITAAGFSLAGAEGAVLRINGGMASADTTMNVVGGKVGIGTATPTIKLDIASATNGESI